MLSAWKRTGFALVPLALLLLSAELVARIPRGRVLRAENFRLLRLEQSRRGYPAVRHPLLGYAPQPDYSSRDNFWGTAVTIDRDGMRANGSIPPPGSPPLVAVGDSFTFGDQVDDDQTWPAYLEAMLGRPVHNGGVFGYSLTQTVLRAEEILQRVPAGWLIVSFIPGDIGRSEFSKRYTWLPYFDIEDGQLVLRNVPVEDLDRGADGDGWRPIKHVLGYSALADALLAHGFEPWWYLNEKTVRVHPPGRGAELALLMVDRLVVLCRERGVRLLWVVQGVDQDAAATAVLARARSSGAETLDLVTLFLSAERQEPGLRERYFHGHMTPAGNRWVAARLHDAIRDVERRSPASAAEPPRAWPAGRGGGA
jgi:hypothetical protein